MKTLLMRVGVVVAVLGLFVAGTARAEKTTSTSMAGNWNAAIWDNGAPSNGDHVVVMHDVTLTNSTPDLASFTITNASSVVTLTFSNWVTALNATNVYVRKNGYLKHAVCNTNAVPGNTNRVYVVCSNLTVEAGGYVDADGSGYPAQQGIGAGGTGSHGGGAGYGGPGGGGYQIGGGG